MLCPLHCLVFRHVLQWGSSEEKFAYITTTQGTQDYCFVNVTPVGKITVSACAATRVACTAP